MKAAVAALFLLCATGPVWAETLRIALYSTELSQKGPGLLLRALTQAKTPQVEAVIDVLLDNQPDILVLQDFDWDLEARALTALQSRLQDGGQDYPFTFTAQPNSGRATGLDLDGDGRTGSPCDAQGFGAFTGAHGIAVLSRHPLHPDQLTDFTATLLQDLPWADLPQHTDGSPFPSAAAQTVQRLSSTNHWILPVTLPKGTRLNLMIFDATPPVFDGAEDQNGKRNHDEIALWSHVLDGTLGPALPDPVVVIGNANLDPTEGQGRHAAIQTLIAHPRLQDPKPQSPRGGTATVDWPTVGQLRVDYILPDAALTVADAGVLWPKTPDDPAARASRHRLVWVDITLP